jgi:hypothetical protein
MQVLHSSTALRTNCRSNKVSGPCAAVTVTFLQADAQQAQLREGVRVLIQGTAMHAARLMM